MCGKQKPSDIVFFVGLTIILVGLALLSIALDLVPEPAALIGP
jgi:hypothetical protein